MSSRRKEREYTLQALYQCDTHGVFTSELIERFFLAYLTLTPEQIKKDKDRGAFARELLAGLQENIIQIDQYICLLYTSPSPRD